MPLLFLNSLPPKTTKGTILRLLIQVGEIDRRKVGSIEVTGRSATIEVPENWIDRLVQALDGENLAGRFIHARRRASGGESGKEDHFQRLIRLLETEAEAEAKQTLGNLRRLSPNAAERTGSSLVSLVIRDESTGLGGRFLVRLAKSTEGLPLPWTRLNTGSPVLLSLQDQPRAAGYRGVVCQRTTRSIEVALQQALDFADPSGPYRLDLTNDEIARERQRTALERSRVAKGDRLAELRGALCLDRKPRFDDVSSLTMLDPNLNDSQREAVEFAMAAEDVAIIHGPPGTGKTTTVVELIRQAVQQGESVLACASSNLAVDNVFERLLAAGEKAVRLGHPARVLPELRDHTLDLIVENHPDVKLARKLVRQANQLFDKAARFTRAKPLPGAKQEMREEARSLKADARRIEAQVVEQVLDQSTVLCTTNTSVTSEILGRRRFDLVVIDEACQSVEPSCWIPLLRANRLVLAGDHCQLPPTVLSAEAAREGFGISMLERLMSAEADQVSRRLSVQYRMHEQIMTFSSAEFYDDSLEAHESVRSHSLAELACCEDNELTQAAIQFIDTAGAGYDEELEPEGQSRLNRKEAELVVRKVQEMVDVGLPPRNLAVITPYSAQVRLLRDLLLKEHSDLEIDSVDGFQGREKEAVIISLVRSNQAGEIGFLGDYRRTNVALTRARRKLIVIGDSATIGSKPFYQRMLEYFELVGAYTSVWNECV